MATPNGTESPNLRREELDTRFNSILLLANGAFPRSYLEETAAELLIERDLPSEERAVEHWEEALRRLESYRFSVSLFEHFKLEVVQSAITMAEKKLIKGAATKSSSTARVEPEVMLGLLANKGELKLFLKRSIAAMGGVSLDRQPAYDAETSLLLKDLIARLRPTDKAAEAACTDSTDSDSQVEL